MSAPDRRAMLDRADKALSVRRQCAARERLAVRLCLADACDPRRA